MTIPGREELIDHFLDLVRYFKIAHHVHGRIRVKAILNTAHRLADLDTDKLNEILARIPGITNYRVNASALSVIIEYNPEMLPYDLWEEIGALRRNPLNLDAVRARLLETLNPF